MEFPDDDDDLDVEALRLAALSTLKKTSAPPTLSHSAPSIHNNGVGGPRVKLQGGPHPPQNRGRGRGMMRGGRGGRGTRGNFPSYHNTAQVRFPKLCFIYCIHSSVGILELIIFIIILLLFKLF